MNRRPIGVVICAVLLGLLSGFMLLMALFSGVAAALGSVMPSSTPPGMPPPQGFVAALMTFNALLYLMFAGWGGTTVFGLFRMRTWSRISMIVIGSCTIVFGLLGAVGIFAGQMVVGSMPMPPNVDPHLLRAVLLIMALVALAGTGVGVWWVVYFALRKTREAFRLAEVQRTGSHWQNATAFAPMSPVADYNISEVANTTFVAPRSDYTNGAMTATKTGRPVSVTVIAILLLIGSFSSLLKMLSTMPLFMFGVILTGWPAHIAMLMWCAVCGVSGFGLLQLQKPALMLAAGLLGATMLNTFTLTLPSCRRNFAEFMRIAMERSPTGTAAPQLPPQFITMIAIVGVVFSVLLTGFLLVLLWRARWAFMQRSTS